MICHHYRNDDDVIIIAMTIVSSCTLVLHYWHKNVLSFRGGTKCSIIPRLSFSKGRREPGNKGGGGGGGGV